MNSSDNKKKMSKQIFKKKAPNNILFELLDKVCLKTQNYYLFDNWISKIFLLSSDLIITFKFRV